MVARVVRPWRWAAAGVGALLAGLLAAVAVLAWGTVAYARAYDGRMLPGTEIAGVDVAGLPPGRPWSRSAAPSARSCTARSASPWATAG